MPPSQSRSRRAHHAASTRAALVDSAVELFTENGYGETSLDAIVSRARVTKGALYHHFSGKRGLFEAAFELVEARVLERLRRIMNGSEPPWQRVRYSLRAFLESCLEPQYQRIALYEAPVVMGWTRWRAAEEDFSLGPISDGLRELVSLGEIDDVPVEVTARMLFGALSTAAVMIASASDPSAVSRQVETVSAQLLARIRRDGVV